jgi:hypothetical protein
MDSSVMDASNFHLSRLQFDDVLLLAVILVLGTCYSLKGVTWDKPDTYRHLWYEKPQSDVAGSRNKETRDIGAKLEETVSVEKSHFISTTK